MDQLLSTPVVVMGIAGSGKTTVARALTERWAVLFVEGDSLHAPSSIEKMARGEPLDDSDREPWVARICTLLQDAHGRSAPCVLACSALRRAHRDQMREACPSLLFIWLDAPVWLIRERMEVRSQETSHYMKAEMLDSQLAAFESPDLVDEEAASVVRIDASGSIAQVVSHAARQVHARQATSRG